MRLRYFKEESYNRIFYDISKNLENYNKNDDKWISNFFKNEEFYKDSRIECSLPTLSILDNISDSDYTNTIAIYDALKDKLTPKQASNPYLWSYLSHCEYWEYTFRRHFSKKSNTGEEVGKDKISIDTVKRRFFCGALDGTRIGFLRNSIAKLWWAGYLTYQEDKPGNPYELTKVLFSHSDIHMQIVERNFAMNKEVVIGLLQTINDFKENPNEKDIAITTEFRELCKYINRYGAVTMLDTLDRNHIRKISNDYILSLRK